MVLVLGVLGIVAAIGMYDDWRPVKAATKLAGQAVAALLLVWCGIHLDLPGGFGANAVVTVCTLVAVTNSINLLDNMNGLAAGIGAIAAAAFMVMGILTDSADVTLLASVVLGACLGFLPFNFPRARVSMGDAGSLSLEFLLGTLLILTSNPLAGQSRLGAVIVLTLPAIDTCLVVTTRLRRRVNPFTTPGSDHISHILARQLASRFAAVTVCWGISALAAMAGIFIALWS